MHNELNAILIVSIAPNMTILFNMITSHFKLNFLNHITDFSSKKNINPDIDMTDRKFLFTDILIYDKI